MIDQNQKLEANDNNELPAHLFPEHLKNLPNETNLNVLRGLILIADKVIEEQAKELDQLTLLAQDAVRYQLLKRMVPGLIHDAAQVAKKGDTTDPLYSALFDIDTLTRRYANLEDGLDEQIQVMTALQKLKGLAAAQQQAF